MSDPTITCRTCGRQRNCMLHQRADHPPTAAKKWLRKICAQKGACEFTYRAGVSSETQGWIDIIRGAAPSPSDPEEPRDE